jgi:hypothetical protein
MVMKLMEDSLVLEMNLISQHVLLTIGSMLIVLMLKILVYLALEDHAVLLLLEATFLLMKLLVLKLVVSLPGLVMLLKEKMLGVLSHMKALKNILMMN